MHANSTHAAHPAFQLVQIATWCVQFALDMLDCQPTSEESKTARLAMIVHVLNQACDFALCLTANGQGVSLEDMSQQWLEYTRPAVETLAEGEGGVQETAAPEEPAEMQDGNTSISSSVSAGSTESQSRQLSQELIAETPGCLEKEIAELLPLVKNESDAVEQWSFVVDERATRQAISLSDYFVHEYFALLPQEAQPPCNLDIAPPCEQSTLDVLTANDLDKDLRGPQLRPKLVKLVCYHASISASKVASGRLMPPCRDPTDPKVKYRVAAAKLWLKKISAAGFGEVKDEKVGKATRTSVVFARKPYEQLSQECKDILALSGVRGYVSA